MWLVGYLFNNNGMGTWCWEAAHALADSGEAVTLLCSDRVELPGNTSIPVHRVGAESLPAGMARFNAPGGMLSKHGPRVVRTAVRELAASGTAVARVLLNSTEFVDAGVAIPQFTAAWAKGISLVDYVSRLRIHARGSPTEVVRSTLSTIGWWRRDWSGFANADAVLAVTTPLTRELRARRLNAYVLYPCTHVSGGPPIAAIGTRRVRLVSSAISLDEPRKRVLWMLQALRTWKGDCELTLIGKANDRIRAVAAELQIPVSFAGVLSRSDALELLHEQDVFLFGSILDDWGYVVTEAMAQGLAVVAPDIAPFNEILGGAGALYEAGSPTAFLATLNHLLLDVGTARLRSWTRASEAFSRHAFAARLKTIVGGTVPAY